MTEEAHWEQEIASLRANIIALVSWTLTASKHITELRDSLEEMKYQLEEWGILSLSEIQVEDSDG